jgi:hypothetical protein
MGILLFLSVGTVSLVAAPTRSLNISCGDRQWCQDAGKRPCSFPIQQPPSAWTYDSTTGTS